MILLESLLLVVIGAILGILPGYFGAIYLSDYFTSKIGIEVEFISFSIDLVLRTLTATVLIGTFVTLFPAFLATRVNIIKALNRVR
jgi:ABC-type antimicrobial peptide transport system permease subunit